MLQLRSELNIHVPKLLMANLALNACHGKGTCGVKLAHAWDNMKTHQKLVNIASYSAKQIASKISARIK